MDRASIALSSLFLLSLLGGCLAQDDAERARDGDAARPGLDHAAPDVPSEGSTVTPSVDPNDTTASPRPITIHHHLRDLDLVLKWNSTRSQEGAITIEFGSMHPVLPFVSVDFDYMNETGARYPRQSSGAGTHWGGGSDHFAPLAWVDVAGDRTDVPILKQGHVWGNFIDDGFPTPMFIEVYDLYEGVSYFLIGMNGLEANITITFEASVAQDVSFEFVRTDRDFVILEEVANPGDWEILVGASAVNTGLVVARNEVLLNETHRFLMLIDPSDIYVGEFTWGDGTSCLLKPGTEAVTVQGPVGTVKVEIAFVKPAVPATVPFLLTLYGYNAPTPPVIPFEWYFCSTIP